MLFRSMACTQGRRAQHGKPRSVVGRGDQPEAGDGQRGRYGVAERPVVLRKPGNAWGAPHVSKQRSAGASGSDDGAHQGECERHSGRRPVRAEMRMAV